MAAAVSPTPRQTFFTNAGVPLNGGLVYTYTAGTLTPQTTYSDTGLSVPISNPIVLNTAGRPQASAIDPTEVNIYYSGTLKFVVKDSGGTTEYTSDNVPAVQASTPPLAFPVTVTGGVSGAVPYFDSTTDLAVSLLLTAHAPMIGGGAGAAPKTVAAMTNGQLLYGVTGADPVPGQAALTYSNPANKTGNATATFKMNGLAATITPVVTGRVIFTITGYVSNDTNGDATTIKMAYGTGAAPANAAAATGTVITATQIYTSTSANVQQGFCLRGIATGLTLNTAVWFDIQIADITGGTAAAFSTDCTAIEV